MRCATRGLADPHCVEHCVGPQAPREDPPETDDVAELARVLPAGD